jgi:cytochrome c oxidase cbb3-type subunit 4
MDINTVRGLLTLVFLVAFLAIVRYAWSARNRARFEAAARLAIDEKETHHG